VSQKKQDVSNFELQAGYQYQINDLATSTYQKVKKRRAERKQIGGPILLGS